MSHYIQISSLEVTSIDDDQIPPLPTEKDEIEEGREVDHLSGINETNGQDSSGSQPREIVNRISGMFKGLDNSSLKSCTIFKVNVGLRESNPGAYTPKMVSIGPYHRKNPTLRPMEKCKVLYLQRFLKRRKGLDLDSCINELEKLKEEALKCYDDTEDLKKDMSFVKMLLFDGCFVVEFIRERLTEYPREEAKIMDTGIGCMQVNRDLLLLENQLPFFILVKLYSMTNHGGELPFAKMVYYCFSLKSTKGTDEALQMHNDAKARNIKHLLHLTHMSWQGDPNTHSSETNESESNDKGNKVVISNATELSEAGRFCNIKHLLHLIHMSWQGGPNTDPSKTNGSELNDQVVISNATELSEAGIKFKSFGNIYRSYDKDDSGDTSLFNIKYENGVLKIPRLDVFDSTESNLRNLIAFEQLSDVHHKYFSEFAIFMDHLIDSEKDVSLLRQKGIIVNRIGEDKEVTRIFNKIGKGVCVPNGFFTQNEGYRKIIEHCERPWNRMKANLKHNYFSSPWVGASTLAAIVLLILTAIQTVLACKAEINK